MGATRDVNLGYPLLLMTQRLLKFARATALLSAAWTILIAVLLVGRQVSSWFQTGDWEEYPLSWAINDLKRTQDSTYTTASANGDATELTTAQEMLGWLLDIPAVVPLLVAAALLLVLYVRLATFGQRPFSR